MYKCIVCGKEFEEWRKKDAIKNNPIPLYCSRNCSNKRVHSKETKEKIKYSVNKYISSHKIEGHGYTVLTPEQEKRRLKSFNDTIKNRLLNKPWEELSEELVKKRLFYEQEGKCNKCGLSEWLGKPISLELEHKDGNHHNNCKENVELLCPNCHAQTDTYRGKNVNNAGKRYADEKLIEAFMNEGTVCKALKSLGMANRGRNYERFIKVLIKYGFNVKKEKGRYVILGH